MSEPYEDNGEYFIIPITKEMVEKHKAEVKGLNELLQRFDETGCYSPENPNHNPNWCSCGKPFCYSCVAWKIVRQYQKNIQLVEREKQGDNHE